MRVLVVGLLVAAALSGCSEAGGGSGSSGPALTPEQVAADRAITSGVAPDNPSAPREDTLSRTPNAEMAAKEWAEASETYVGFTVQESRVADSERAWVRVTYSVTTSPGGGSPYAVTVDEPGEWWPLHKVDGAWKVGWMPRH
jgi:hypothetical protein